MIASENNYDRIEIVEREEVDSDFGGKTFTGNYIVLFKTAVREIYVSGREKEIHDQLTALRRVKFKVRYKSQYKTGLTEDLLIRYNNEIYDIRGVDHVKRKDTFISAERAKE